MRTTVEFCDIPATATRVDAKCLEIDLDGYYRDGFFCEDNCTLVIMWRIATANFCGVDKHFALEDALKDRHIDVKQILIWEWNQLDLSVTFLGSEDRYLEVVFSSPHVSLKTASGELMVQKLGQK
jgi:hypothetical protein